MLGPLEREIDQDVLLEVVLVDKSLVAKRFEFVEQGLRRREPTLIK